MTLVLPLLEVPLAVARHALGSAERLTAHVTGLVLGPVELHVFLCGGEEIYL